MDGLKSAPFPAYKGKKPFIFVSYAHRNTDVVYPYLIKLNDMGYRIWYDEGIEPGREWPEAIATAIEECACVVTFLSPEAVASMNVRNEINFALINQKKMLCIYIKDTALPKGLALQLGTIQAIMEYKIHAKELFLNQLFDSLPAESKEMKTEKQTVKQEDSDHKGQKRKKLFWIIAAAVSVFAAALFLPFSPVSLIKSRPISTAVSDTDSLSSEVIQPDAAADAHTTIRVLYTSAAETKALRESFNSINKAFEAKYPQYTVAFQFSIPEGNNDKNQTGYEFIEQVSPTVAFTGTDDIISLRDDGFAEDLTSRATSELDFGKYYGLDVYRLKDGEFWYLPLNFWCMMLVYNKEIFTQCAVPFPTSDWTTQDELNAETLLAQGGYPNSIPLDYFHFIQQKMMQFGVYTVDTKNKYRVQVSSSNLKIALDFMQKILLANQSHPGRSSSGNIKDWIQAGEDFFKGNVPFFYAYDAEVLPQLASATDIPFGLTPIPQRSDSQGDSFVNFCSSSCVCLNRQVGETEKSAGWEYIKYLLSDDAQTLLQHSEIPISRAAARERFGQSKQFPALEDVIEASIPRAEYIVRWLFTSDGGFAPVGKYLLGDIAKEDAIQQVTDYFSLSAPPSIASFTADTASIQRGGVFTMTAQLDGDGDYEIYADLTDLDSASAPAIWFTKTGANTYTATACLSFDSSTAAGIKTIPLTVTDAAGNTVTKSIQIELLNEAVSGKDAVSPDDSFDGSMLDTSKWNKDVQGSVALDGNGGLLLTAEPRSFASIYSNWYFIGDFDVQISFSKDQKGDPSLLVVSQADTSVKYSIVKRNDSFDTVSDSQYVTNGKTENSLANQGILRAVRHENTLLLLYYTAGRWTLLSTSVLPEGGAQIVLLLNSNDDQAITKFDDFRINYGLTNYPQK